MSEYQEIDKDDNDAVAEIELPESGTVEVVGVRFREAGKVYYFKTGEEALKPDDLVIVETARGDRGGYCCGGSTANTGGRGGPSSAGGYSEGNC
jgi:hypothetical protein